MCWLIRQALSYWIQASPPALEHLAYEEVSMCATRGLEVTGTLGNDPDRQSYELDLLLMLTALPLGSISTAGKLILPWSRLMSWWPLLPSVTSHTGRQWERSSGAGHALNRVKAMTVLWKCAADYRRIRPAGRKWRGCGIFFYSLKHTAKPGR